jgi:hypothetical protein
VDEWPGGSGLGELGVLAVSQRSEKSLTPRRKVEASYEKAQAAEKN